MFHFVISSIIPYKSTRPFQSSSAKSSFLFSNVEIIYSNLKQNKLLFLTDPSPSCHGSLGVIEIKTYHWEVFALHHYPEDLFSSAWSNILKTNYRIAIDFIIKIISFK